MAGACYTKLAGAAYITAGIAANSKTCYQQPGDFPGCFIVYTSLQHIIF